MAEIVVRELTPDLVDEWLAFFDRDAFADNPDWCGCYCHYFHADHSERDWDSRTPAYRRRGVAAAPLDSACAGFR
jgi:hypothetical protein